MKNRTSIIWTISKERLEELVRTQHNLFAILEVLGFKSPHGSYKKLQTRLRQEGIDFSQIYYGSGKGKRASVDRKPLELVLVENSDYPTARLKKRLVAERGWTLMCAGCAVPELWQGKPLSLEMDHINGVSNDHRIHNLRLLCPNCHSQTDTFRGRNSRIHPKQCKYCSAPISSSAKNACCGPCYFKVVFPTVERKYVLPASKRLSIPCVETLLRDIHSMGYDKAAAKYGATGSGVRAWLKAHDITLPTTKRTRLIRKEGTPPS